MEENITPASDEQIAEWDNRAVKLSSAYYGVTFSKEEWDALRLRLDQEIERRESAEKVVEAAGIVASYVLNGYRGSTHAAKYFEDLFAAHRAAWPKEGT